MARSTTARHTTVGNRAALIEHARERAANYRPRVDAEEGCFISPWPRLLADLEEGRAVMLSRWQLPRSLRTPGASFSRLELGTDGQLRRVAR